MYKKVHNLRVYSAIFYNHESEVRPEEYVTRKITKSVARIYYGKQKKNWINNLYKGCGGIKDWSKSSSRSRKKNHSNNQEKPFSNRTS